MEKERVVFGGKRILKEKNKPQKFLLMLLACAILISSILTVYITINSTPRLITGYASS